MPSSWSQHEVLSFALALPEAQVHDHRGRPSVQVRGRIFVTLPLEAHAVNLKTTPLALDMLLRSDPTVYRDAWGSRWVGVDLRGVDPTELRSLIVEGYCLAAPKPLHALARSKILLA